jgi:hypothetical protein
LYYVTSKASKLSTNTDSQAADAEEKVGKGEEKKKENAKDDGRADQAAK